MHSYQRSHTCGELGKAHIGETVTLSGWVHRRRDHGGLIFIDLRDRFGLTQLVFDPAVDKKAHESASQLRAEWVISIKGKVIPRTEGMENPKLKTGTIEVEIKHLEILSQAHTPPFSICDEITETHEETRLKYRYLDLRRGDLAQKLISRHQIVLDMRNFLDQHGFIEIQTPILGKSTPEGARDYLVPSRIYPGQFYALPQSPQLFKQLLMMSGMDRYFQVATCFRDEDLRADRQPEFTQLDIELSFQTPEYLRDLMEKLFVHLFKQRLNLQIEGNFPSMTYHECLEHYGTDKPDLRFGMPLIRVDDVARDSSFSIFKGVLDSGGCIKALCVKGGAEISRKEIDRYTNFVGNFGLKGLAWMKYQDEGLSSSIVKFFSDEVQKRLIEKVEAEVGDLLLFAAADEHVVNQSLDQLRRLIGEERNLIDTNAYKFLWVTDWPIVEYDPEEGRMVALHHPFTSPHPDDIHMLDEDPLKVRALAYDLVLNGYEIGGGSQRIHSSEVQNKIFHLLKLTPEQIKEQFGFFIEALKYGTPPHLGIAFGIDRICMIMTKTTNIRDVIAFPKTTKASDLMTKAPSHVEVSQLDELGIETKKPVGYNPQTG